LWTTGRRRAWSRRVAAGGRRRRRRDLARYGGVTGLSLRLRLWPRVRRRRGRDFKVEPVMKRLIDELEVPPLPEIGTEARLPHVGFQCLTVASCRLADKGV